ncbi:MAG: CCA tRNA nucleotidyltransferase [Marinilabiliaceae bacterium]
MTTIENKKNYKEALRHRVFGVVRDIVGETGQPAFVIGGFVRDLLLGIPSQDIDIVVQGSGIDLARAVHERFRGSKLSVFKNFGTAQVKMGPAEVEFVGARKESYRSDSRKPIVEDGTIDDDQKRRDFTINALALSLNPDTYGDIVDPFGGIDDLQNGIIRTPLDPEVTFSDDPLRMLRGIRFATRLQFAIADETLEGMSRMAPRIEIISQERVTDELMKSMETAAAPSLTWKLLDKVGLLQYILPELSALKGVEKRGRFAHKDVFYHTMQVLDGVAAQSDDVWLRWAALFHDIGKPRTKRFEDGTGWTFRNHNYVGAKMLPKIFTRMKLPLGEPLKFVQKMVNLHMRPIVLSEDVVTDSAVRRVLFEAGDDVEKLMTLCECDITSRNEDKVQRYLRNFKIVRRKMKEIEEKDHVRNFQPPITGEEIMRTFGIPPSHPVGVIKDAIKEAILDGVIHNDYDEARQLMISEAAKLGLTPVGEQ